MGAGGKSQATRPRTWAFSLGLVTSEGQAPPQPDVRRERKSARHRRPA